MKKYYTIFLLLLTLSMPCIGNNSTQKLFNAMQKKNSLVCVGLDPDFDKIPFVLKTFHLPKEEIIYSFLTKVIDITAEHACAFKIQKAFYDQYPKGHNLLRRIVQYINTHYQDTPAFIDCKIGDIDNTMQAYVHNLFDHMQADGIVINPYMGDDVFSPFLSDPSKTALVLIQTSNPSAKIVQELPLSSGEMLWEKVLTFTLERWNQNQNLILILSSNSENYDYQNIRKKIASHVPILLAGIGAQGGNLSVLKDLLNENGLGVFVNSSRGLLYPYSVDCKNWEEKVEQETIKLKNRINAIRYDTL